MKNLMCKGKVVSDHFGFTLSVLSFQVWFMIGKTNKNEAVLHDISWVWKEPLDVISLFSFDGAAEIPHLSVGRKEDWEVSFPNTSDRICSKYIVDRIPMFETVFKEIGFRLPFSPIQISLFQRLALCPSQLHLNSYPFIKAFELVCQYLCVSPLQRHFL